MTMTTQNRRLESTRTSRTEFSLSIRQAQISDQDEIARMCALLWPETSIEEHREEIGRLLTYGMYGILPATILTCYREDGTLNGFLQVGLRSHADGCDPSQPVGFIEGWFVYEHFRGQGIGTALMRAAENWARDHGCKEMASVTWIDHTRSQKAHEALGFEIVDRCVNFRKQL
jgi:aminoglycoside 6'-N-acetyltransferase I